jgi:WD40 repeat protein
MFWEIDKNGRLLDEDEPIDASALAVKAVESIVADLTTRHEWTPEFIAASTLTADIQAALKKVETKHRIAQNTKVDTAKFTGFGSTPFNQDGTRLLYVTRNLSQSSASRGALQPHVAVWDVNVGKELFRMQGHTDEIMWAGFNPDGSRIATVSWDGTLRMHNGHTGSLHWASPNSGGQSWAGDFSPDGKHIVWSSKGGQSIRVFDVEKGECQATFPLQVRNWVRSLEWNPDGRSIAIGGFSAYVWHPFGGTPAGTVELEVRVKSDGPATFASFDHVKWLDDAKLAVGCSDGSIVVWDHYSNLKEGFLRPHGLIAEGYAGLETHFLKEKETYLTLNNDGIVRFWRHTVPASLNNTKKRKSTVPDGPSKVTTIPEHDKAPVDDWLEKGAELWTAE